MIAHPPAAKGTDRATDADATTVPLPSESRSRSHRALAPCRLPCSSACLCLALRSCLFAATLLASSAPLRAQQRNAGFEPNTFAITNARLILSPEQEIEQGTLVIRDGLIVAAGKDVAAPSDAEVVDGTGLTVYPGFIDAGTSALLDPNRGTAPSGGRPIDFSRFALAATPPDNRKSLTPEFEAPQGLKTDLGGIEARRKLGFTTVHIIPGGRIAGGQGALLTTSGLPLREALLVSSTFPQF